MNRRPIVVLLIDSDPRTGPLLEKTLAESDGPIQLNIADTLEIGLQELNQGQVSAVLLGINGSENAGVDAFKAIQKTASVPIVVLGDADTVVQAKQIVHAGAADYLVRTQLSCDLLTRTIDHVLETKKLRDTLQWHVKRLRNNEAQMREMIDRLHEGAIVLNDRGIVELVNDAAQMLYGVSSRSLIGKRLDLPLEPGTYIEETKIRHHGGKDIPVQIQTVEIEWYGKPARLVFLRDLTSTQQAQATATELRVAREIQFSLMPYTDVILPGFDIAGVGYPAEQVGGDYFDYITMPNDRLGIVMGDASGHGIGPALIMAQTRACVYALSQLNDCPGTILSKCNVVLSDGMPDGRFITLIMAVLNIDERTMVFANAGHPTGYIIDAHGQIKQKLESTDLPVGVHDEITYEPSETIQLDKGDLILLFTDGLPETDAPDGALFGEERILDLVKKNLQNSTRDIVNSLYEAAGEFQGEFEMKDDISIIVIKVES